VTFGWIHAIRRGHAVLHRGLDVGVPNLVLRSDRSVREATDPDLIQRGDAVLDVDQIARWAGCLGNRTLVVPIADAKHDVFLSVPEVRKIAFHELDSWLNWYSTPADTAPENTGAATQPE
jgi:alpha-beta hydrolase superfamily lysophospholipase